MLWRIFGLLTFFLSYALQAALGVPPYDQEAFEEGREEYRSTQAIDSLKAELLWYPAGIIFGAAYEKALLPGHYLYAGAGVNFTDRRSWGEQDSEKGSGWGLHLGYRNKVPFIKNLSWGLQTHLWKLNIDWEVNTIPVTKGETEIWVLQPTVNAQYDFWKDAGMSLAAKVALGAEFNIETEGEEVGQGAIFLLGLDYSWNLQ